MLRFHFDDAPALVDLSGSVGWTHTLDDWRTALAAGAVFGHRDGALIKSSSAIYKYGTELVSIGQVIVRETARRQGLARSLVLHCLDQAPASPTMLVATQAGQPLYESLGFRIIEPTLRAVNSSPTAAAQRPTGCREMQEADLPLACALDADAYGADRGHLLRAFWKQVTHAAIFNDGSGFAWCTAQHTGPVIAPGAEQAAQLVSFLAATQQIVIDVPGRQSKFLDMLMQAGLHVIGERPLMLLHADKLPGRRSTVFGLAALAYG